MTNTSILVTGGTGFIGSHVVDQLISTGHAVRCLVRPNRPSLSWLSGLPVDVISTDPLGSNVDESFMEGIHTVIHVAGTTKARRYDDYYRGNVELTTRLLDQAIRSGVTRFVYLSSLTAVGPSTDGRLLDESAPCVPITNYGRSKLAGEHACRERSAEIGVTIVRPPAVYGPRDHDILEIFRWVSFGMRPTVGSREKTISLIHARDLAAGVIRAALEPRAVGQTYFMSDPQPYRFSSLINLVAKLSERRSYPVFIPGWALYAAAGIAQTASDLAGRTAVLTVEKARDLLQRYWVCSSELARRELGFSTETTIEAGVRETFDWYKQQGWLRYRPAAHPASRSSS